MNSDQQSNYWKPTDESGETPAVDASQVTQEDQVASRNDQQSTPPEEVVSWQANEYLHMERNTGWFVGLGVVTAILLAISIFFMQSVTFSLLIVVMVVAVITLSLRPPRTLKYTLSSKGLYVMDQLYGFDHFKAFGILIDHDEYSIVLLPTKRFSPEVTVYFPQGMGEQIVDFLGQRLPMQELRMNIVDKLIRKLRL